MFKNLAISTASDMFCVFEWHRLLGGPEDVSNWSWLIESLKLGGGNNIPPLVRGLPDRAEGREAAIILGKFTQP